MFQTLKLNRKNRIRKMKKKKVLLDRLPVFVSKSNNIFQQVTEVIYFLTRFSKNLAKSLIWGYWQARDSPASLWQ
jgi:hypothetical protein